MKILMVCAGNICRSPLAEGIMRHYINHYQLQGWEVDSAGTENYFAGGPPDTRSTQTGAKYGIDISQQKARQFQLKDLDSFDVIYIMDTHNYRELMRIWIDRNPAYQTEYYMGKIKFILNETYPKQNRAVPDPYYGGIEGFETVYSLLDNACRTIAQKYQ